MPLILLNKPYQVLSQFRDADGRRTVAEFVQQKDVYPAGRLDYDSEGLLLLTDDGKLQARISQPDSKVRKTYWAQVEGEASENQLASLREGVDLADGNAIAHTARAMTEPAWLWRRSPPIRIRKSIPDSWIELSISEGRNRQVRRMTAAVGLPTLRLIRTSIGPWSLDGLEPGETRYIATRDAWLQIASQIN
ncbi:MAG: pseudouridine synthase [Gammaproteobacteria bacterium]|nr:pseudouridine synthase [Gammaproteobacteria bacterium]MDH3414954.1 pseudouridine synthase [Gammaproteobacteria bacterium]